jgi:hypothetical protein
MTMLSAALALLAALQSPGPPRKDVKARPIASPTAQVEVQRQAGEGAARFEILLRPVDMLGRPLGPGRVADLGLTASVGRLLGELEDRGDGVYARTLELAAGDDPAAVELTIEVLGAATRVPLESPASAPEAELERALADSVAQARKDLAGRLEVAEADVELVDADRVTWPDGSLGCPRPGLAYTQALVPGVRVRLRVAGVVYAYHGARRGGVSLCENPVEPVPVRSR